MSHVRIEMTGPKTGKVWVDGVELSNVNAVRFAVDVADTIASVEIIQRLYGDIEITGDMDVTVLDNHGARQFANADG